MQCIIYCLKDYFFKGIEKLVFNGIQLFANNETEGLPVSYCFPFWGMRAGIVMSGKCNHVRDVHSLLKLAKLSISLLLKTTLSLN